MDILRRAIKKTGIYRLRYLFFPMRGGANSKGNNYKDAIKRLDVLENDINSSSYYRYNFAIPEYDATIILPVYNSERYIAECLKSILSQKTRYSFEVLVVNDGSTDNTRHILNEIDDPRVRVFNQDNKGVSYSRNVGLFNSKGKYLIFCDSDDFMPDNAIDLLLNTAKKTNADVVEGNFRYVDEKGKHGRLEVHFNANDKRVDKRVYTRGVPWGKCFKRELFENLIFPLHYWYEDSIIHHVVLARAKKIVWINKIVYYYRINRKGLTSLSQNSYRSIDSLWITLSLYTDRVKYFKIEYDQQYYYYLLKMMRLTYYRTQSLPLDVKKDIFFVYSHFIRSNFHKVKIPFTYPDFINIQRIIWTGTFEDYSNYFNRT